MPEYRVALKSSAEKELLRLPDPILARIFPKIEALTANPRPFGSKKLHGSRDLWRIRVGDYRAIYAIDDKAQTIHVMRIAHRRDVYD